MAQVWALMDFTNADGKHEVGEKFDLPRNTDEEKADFERLLREGVVTDREPSDGSSGRKRRQGAETEG